MELSGVQGVPGRSFHGDVASLTSLSRDQLVRKLAAIAGTNNIPALMSLLATYADASHFLLARNDLIQEQGLDFIIASNWPFDLVRRLGVKLAGNYSKSTEMEKCLSLLTPVFGLLPEDVLLPENVSRQYCSLTFCIGRARFSLMLLFQEGIVTSHERLREIGLLAAYGASFSESAGTRSDRDFDLTERELECLFWISEGKTSDEIATILGISRNTINNYITSVMRKTATKTRSEAIAYAVRNNLV